MSVSKAIYLEFPRSDGSPERWPTDKLDSTPVNGEVNYMREILRNEPLSLKWRVQTGREVAKLLGKSEYDNYVLKDFPEGYRFYHHNKGPADDPRTDAYLYGSASGRYRSPPEFIHHAYWLMTDETLNRKNCLCKYCGTSKKAQTEISHSLGLKSGHWHSSSGSGLRGTKPKLRVVAQPRKRQHPLGSVVNHERTADLRVSHRYRPGEIVWCALSPPVRGEREHERLEFWPAIVNEARLRSDALPHPPGEPWRVVQSTVYRVKLLGVLHSHVLPETSVLPYQAYGPPAELVDSLRAVGDPKILQERQKLFQFHPLLQGGEAGNQPQLSFVDASTPFAFAIQIAAHLVRSWTPTDEWKFRGEVATSPSATPATGDSAGPPAGGAQMVELNETRYQGLWWGAERIWADELVRIQPARAQVVPQGSSTIHPASPRADGRGVLMRINGLIAVAEGPLKENPRECKVAGVLYELADEGYEEEHAPESSVNAVGVSASSAQPVTDGVAPADAPASTTGPESAENIAGAPENPSQAPTPTSPINPPNIPSYPLPKPPSGLKFRPISKEGHEIVLDVSFIAGRYYPDLLKHPLLRNILTDINLDDSRVSQLSSLCGLLAGSVNSMECVDWVATRVTMLKDADALARQELLEHWHPSEVQMEGVSEDGKVETEDVSMPRSPNQ